MELLHGVVHRVRTRMHQAIADDESGLAHMETRALQFVAKHPDSTPSDIVKHSGRDKGQVARLLNSLVERGFLARTERSDRRSHSLHLTAAGRAVHRRIGKKRNEAAAQLFSDFTDSERKVLADFLRRMSDE